MPIRGDRRWPRAGTTISAPERGCTESGIDTERAGQRVSLLLQNAYAPESNLLRRSLLQEGVSFKAVGEKLADEIEKRCVSRCKAPSKRAGTHRAR